MILITFDNGCWHVKAGTRLTNYLSTRQLYPCYFVRNPQRDNSYANKKPRTAPTMENVWRNF